MTPPKKKRRKLLLLAARFDDAVLELLLSKIWPIYETSLPLSLPAQAVVNEVDAYYDAYDPNGEPDTFDACAAEELDSNTKGERVDALEAAVNTWEG